MSEKKCKRRNQERNEDEMKKKNETEKLRIEDRE